MLRIVLGVLVLLQVSGCVSALPKAQQGYEGSYAKYPSGLRLVVYSRGSERHSSLHLSYRAGAVDEPQGQEGIGQLALSLSQLARTEGPESPPLKERFAAVGGAFQAVTGYDVTELWAQVPALQLVRVLELEAQRMRDPLAHVTEAEFLAERERLAQVMGLVQAAPAARDLLQREVLADHPYGRPLWGTPASVRALSFEAVRAWARAHYVPERAVLVVTGGLPSAEVSEAVRAAFGPLAVGGHTEPHERAPAPLPEAGAQPLVVKRAAVRAPHLWMVWRAPGLSAGKNVEAQAMVSMLQNEVIPFLVPAVPGSERRHMAAGAWTMDGTTLIYLRARLQHAGQVDAVRAVVEERLRFRWGNMVGQGTADQVRERVLALARKEAHALPADAVARYLRVTGSPDFPGAWPAQVQQTPLADIRAYAQRYLRAKQARSFLLIPGPDAVEAPPALADLATP